MPAIREILFLIIKMFKVLKPGDDAGRSSGLKFQVALGVPRAKKGKRGLFPAQPYWEAEYIKNICLKLLCPAANRYWRLILARLVNYSNSKDLLYPWQSAILLVCPKQTVNTSNYFNGNMKKQRPLAVVKQLKSVSSEQK